MEIDYLIGERVLPVHVISVRLAATIFAYEMGAWSGHHFTDAEIEPFMDSETGELRGTTRTHAWETLELTGGPLRAREAIESLLCRDIDAGLLQTLQVRRELDGALVTTDTILDVDKARDWTEVYKLDVGDWFDDYTSDETTIAEQALSTIKQEWERLQDADRAQRLRERATGMQQEDILDLLRENERLRNSHQAANDKPLDPRQRTTLLRIIRALDVLAELPERGAAGSVEIQLQKLGFDGPKDASIRKWLDAARALEPD